jgi:predicted nucleotidyltransferase
MWPDVVDAYLGRVDAAAPGLVEGFYLVGSLALGDYRPGTSDVDFVAVTRRSSVPEVAGRWRLLDGVYTTWEELATDAARDPVAWHTLKRCGVRVRGPEPPELTIATDRSTLDSWCRANLDGYWRRWRRDAGRPLSRRWLAGLGTWGQAWAVLGVSRLHYTIATGDITSKSGGGRYALSVFPSRWHPIVTDCLATRQGGASSLPRLVRHRETLAFLDMALLSY